MTIIHGNGNRTYREHAEAMGRHGETMERTYRARAEAVPRTQHGIIHE